MFQNFYNPATWPRLTSALNKLFEGEVGSDVLQLLALSIPTNATALINNEITSRAPLLGIKCSDSFPRAATLNELQPAVDRIHKSARLLGDTQDPTRFVCARWKFNAKQRYEGDFNVKTKNPMLILSNRVDAVAPLAGAKNLSATFQGSRLLEIDGYGVSSLISFAKTHLPCVFVTLSGANNLVYSTRLLSNHPLARSRRRRLISSTVLCHSLAKSARSMHPFSRT